MIKWVSALSAAVLLGFAAMVFAADATPPTAAAAPASVDVAARIDALLAMSPADRRAALKAMDRGERRGLWLQVKRTQAERRGLQRQRYAGNAGHAVTAKPSAASRAAAATIRYDSGFPTIGFGGGAIIGNRFNTQLGNPLTAAGTISTIQALVVPGPANTTSSAGFVIEGPQTVGGAAFHLFSTFTGATGVVDALTFTGLGVTYTGSSFFVLFGDFASVYIPVYGTESNLGQGHHGVVGYTGGMGPDITGTFDFGGALNSFIRASGNLVLPVELTSFDIE